MGNEQPIFKKNTWYPFKGNSSVKNIYHNGKGLYS